MNETVLPHKPHLAMRIIEQRSKKGLSQESLADISGLSLRTIQRIEKGESIPRGATLRKLAQVLTINAEELIDLDLDADPNMLALINLAQLSGLIFPLLGIIVPLAIWLVQRNRVQYINELGLKILNFQLFWNTAVFAIYGFGLLAILWNDLVSRPTFLSFVTMLALVYLYMIALVSWNTFMSHKAQQFWYKPSISLLR